MTAQTEPAKATPDPRPEPEPGPKTYIVGIGASAGGLEAITQLVGHLRQDVPCAYIVLQHLSPTYRSMMVEILARETPLKVVEVEQGVIPQPGVIHVVPANFNALLKDGRLHLVNAPPEVVPKSSINQFLISLASEEGESAVGIVLSGTGSDGTAGLRAIQAAGGFTYAQDPETAKYDGMPRAAIDAGVADYILSPDRIASHLPRILNTPAPENEGQPDLLEQLLREVKEKLQFDFSGYKVGTLMRRVRRRQIATDTADLGAYMDWVRRNPGELETLARDILISVTAFFRDREAFDMLKSAVGELCVNRKHDAEIRVWVAGCASGEEAYSIAMLFAEALGPRLEANRVQIFATDIDDEALNVARRGIYSAASMGEVPSDLLNRYFRPVNQHYEVGKTLRDMIVFARHNLVSDPPFLRLQLVSCRNLLIYFDPPLQSKVLNTFHYGLQRDGYLFLGRSESVTQAEGLFSSIGRRERLFRKKGDSAPSIPWPANTQMKTVVQRKDHRLALLLRAMASHFDMTAALCDSNGLILHTIGKVDRYFHFPVGASRLFLSEVVEPSLRGELLTMTYRCHQQGTPQQSRRRKFRDAWVRMFVEPVDDDGGTLQFVLFQADEAQAAEPAPGPDARTDAATESEVVPPSRQLEDELVATREHLQTMVEEMATANEEMQALNEEAQATNEELQATNEELEAANEELQATNEELVSLNEELNVKTAELSTLYEEYASLYDALDFPILVFDRESCLVRFNQAAAGYYELRATALRQPVSRLRLGCFEADINTLLGRVLAHGQLEMSVVNQADQYFQLVVSPGAGRTHEVNRIIVTLLDVSLIKQAESRLAESEARMSALMERTTLVFAMKDLRGNYVYANPRYLAFFGIPADAYKGQDDFALLPAELAAGMWEMDLKCLRERALVERVHQFDLAGRYCHLRTTHQVLTDADGQPTALIVEGEDITVQKQAEVQLLEYQQNLEGLVAERTRALLEAKEAAEAANAAKTVFLANMSHELRTPLNGMMGMTDLAARRSTDPVQKDRLDKALRSARHLLGIINDILDLSKIEANRMRLNNADFLLEDSLTLVRDIVEPKARGKGLSLELFIAPALRDRLLQGDPKRLEQVLLNLLGNAVKFTHQGGIRLDVLDESEQGETLWLRFNVRDTGIGIAEADQARLFTPFEQVDQSHTRQYGGTGLGLAISSRLVSLMGGRIGVDSQPGKGSTFWFSVPLHKVVSAARPERAVSHCGEGEPMEAAAMLDALKQRCAGLPVLVVEDEPINLEICRFMLEDAGMVVDVAGDGLEALDLIESHRYALIVMDMQMPRMNGLDATRAIRALEGWEQIPIIATTANAFEHDRQVCLDAGMSDHLPKPITPETLYAMLCKWLTPKPEAVA